MADTLSVLGWLLFGVSAPTWIFLLNALRQSRAKLAEQTAGTKDATLVLKLLQSHFAPTSLQDITITEWQFPFRVRADLQRAIDRLFASGTTICHFCGVGKAYSYSFDGVTLTNCLIVGERNNPALSVPPQYEEVDVGDIEPVRCLKNGLWLLQEGANEYAVLLGPVGTFTQITGIQFQIAVVNNQEGTRITQGFFKHLEESVLRAESYRGKILSLEQSEPSYKGASTGITVHTLRTTMDPNNWTSG